MTLELYDTTLRDGAQMEGLSLSVEDKLKIARKLDELGVHYIEGGWPGSNPKDAVFFVRAQSLQLQHARLVGRSAYSLRRTKRSGTRMATKAIFPSQMRPMKRFPKVRGPWAVRSKKRRARERATAERGTAKRRKSRHTASTEKALASGVRPKKRSVGTVRPVRWPAVPTSASMDESGG